MENQLENKVEKKMENRMKTWITWGCIGTIANGRLWRFLRDYGLLGRDCKQRYLRSHSQVQGLAITL